VGLADSIRFEAAMMKKSGLMDVQFQISGSEIELNEQKSIFLFRMFQECMNNILKHAEATLVLVNVNYLDDLFTLEIKDNGIGFNVAEKKQSTAPGSGVGLKSIFNRAQLIGADISINSKPNQGTVVLIKLPLVDK
jgi:two-component system NarL family sensor kinase